MSQMSSSISSNDNSQIKYKKALIEIQKIRTANKLLKSQFDQKKGEYEDKINKMYAVVDQISKSKQKVESDKSRLQKLCQEQQANKSELKKEIIYLNNILAEQNSELRKVKAMKDDKTFSALIISYENRQKEYRQDINRQEQLLKSIKISYETLEKELTEERRLRFQFEDVSRNLKMQIDQYRDLNLNLLNKNESIVAMMVNRTNEGKEKYLQTEIVLGQLSKQLQIIKNAKLQQQSLNNLTVSRASYESLIQEKSKIQTEATRLRQRVYLQENRSASLLSMEQKMKKTSMVAQQLSQENNMLKNKIIMMQTKNIMKDSVEEDGQLKQYENNFIVNAEGKEALSVINNSAQPSHFQLMKSYIMELKEKLSINMKEKKEIEKKYYSIKEKIGEWTEKILSFEEQDKLLRGKLEGFQRLTQRLEFQLKKNMNIYEQEMSKMKQTTTIILNKRSEQIKAANSFFRCQLDQQRDKLEKNQKRLQQQIENMRQEIRTEKIKYTEAQGKYEQANEFLNIYKTKFNSINIETKQADKSNKILSDSTFRYEQLYRQEQAKNESLVFIKGSLTNKINQLNNQLRQKLELQSEIELIRENKQREIQQLREELVSTKKQIENFREKLRTVKKQIQDKKGPRTSYLKPPELQQDFNSAFNHQNDKNRQLQTELQTLKLHLDRSVIQSQRVQSLESSINVKNDEINNLKKRIIAMQKQASGIESRLREESFELERIKQQNNILKSTLSKNTQQLKKSSQFWETENQKHIQKLNEQLANANWELREERKTGARTQYDLQSYQSEVKRLEQFIDQNKKKELATFQELNQLRASYQLLCEESQRLKSQLKFKNNLQGSLNVQISKFQQHIDKLNSQNSELRSKIQTLDNDIYEIQRQLSSLRIYLSEVEEFADKRVASGSWQQQRDKQNLKNLIQKIKEIVWANESSPKINVEYYSSPHHSAPVTSQNNLKSVEQNVVNHWAPRYDGPSSNFLNINNNGSKYFKNMDYY